jgi:hypothetical protein
MLGGTSAFADVRSAPTHTAEGEIPRKSFLKKSSREQGAPQRQQFRKTPTFNEVLFRRDDGSLNACI